MKRNRVWCCFVFGALFLSACTSAEQPDAQAIETTTTTTTTPASTTTTTSTAPPTTVPFPVDPGFFVPTADHDEASTPRLQVSKPFIWFGDPVQCPVVETRNSLNTSLIVFPAGTTVNDEGLILLQGAEEATELDSLELLGFPEPIEEVDRLDTGGILDCLRATGALFVTFAVPAPDAAFTAS